MQAIVADLAQCQRNKGRRGSKSSVGHYKKLIIFNHSIVVNPSNIAMVDA